MGIDFNEIKKKAQEALGHNAGKIEQGLDKASGFAKSKFGQHSSKIDNVTSKAKDFLHKQSGGGHGEPGPQGGPGPAGPQTGPQSGPETGPQSGPTGPTGPTSQP
ncbi:antitoxin [Amycolatopsis sp. ATCC 39116]|uniref:antitoxin n=1 Tax=Amycolatopsis sp. (strain ATCC 39116 / 75iv2) TaxID=385957 RepID=UPI0002626A09|nr:antitoxin [Amycolatopsis sp. ATCC 39116]